MSYKAKFDWQAGREELWEALPSTSLPKRSKRNSRLWLTSVALIILVATTTVILQIKRRVDTVGVTNRAQLLAVHQHVDRAAWSGDEDLFLLALYPDGTRWLKVQQALFEQGLFLDRAPLGLWAQLPSSVHKRMDANNEASTPDTRVILNPELDEAQVIERTPFTIEVSAGVTGTVFLDRMLNFRKLDGEWLLAPVSDEHDFWGSWIREEGEAIRLIYPSRDESVGLRLFPELDDLVGRLCTDDQVDCPAEFRLQLRLARESGSLLRLYQMRSGMNTGSFHMDLPAPTLVGRPVDEAGYQALYRGYAAWVAAAIVANFSQSILVDYSVLDRYLKPLDLRPPALAESRPLQQESPPPIPLPEQDVMMLCNSYLPPKLLRYHLDDDSWSDETEGEVGARYTAILRNSSPVMFALPDDSGLLIQVRQAINGTPRWRTYILINGKDYVILDEDKKHAVIPPALSAQANIDRDELVFYEVPQEGRWNIGAFRLRPLDCLGSDCQKHPLDGLPFWSPGRRRTILVESWQGGFSSLALGDAEGNATTVIGAGGWPLWIDDEDFAYIRPIEMPLQYSEDGLPVIRGSYELVRASAATGAEEILLTTDDLLPLVPTDRRTDPLWLRSLSPRPGEPDMWYLWATTLSQFPAGSDLMFSYQVSSGEIHLVLDLGDQRLSKIGVSDNDRYAAIITTRGSSWSLRVFNFETGNELMRTAEWTTEPNFDWSADGLWLATTDAGVLRLIAPGYDYERAVFHNLSGCSSVTWVNN